MQLSIKTELKQLEKNLDKLSKKALPKATVSALNKTGKSIQSAAIKNIARESKLKQKDIRKAIAPFAFTASRQEPKFMIKAARAKASNLIAFVNKSQRNSQTFRKRSRKGFKYSGVVAKAWGVKKEYQGTFIGRGRNSGKLLVLKREGRTIKSVMGASPRSLFNKRETRQLMIATTKARFPLEMGRALARSLRRLK